MKEMKREEQLKIEEIFNQLKNSMDDKSILLKDLSSILNKIYKKTFTIKIIPMKERQYSFVMSVIPESSTIDKIIAGIVEEKTKMETIRNIWKKCNKWLIEIDERILESAFTKEELTALLLHEVGHIVDSDAIPTRLVSIIQYGFASSSVNVKSTLKKKMFSGILKIPVIHSCMYQKAKNGIKKEIKADYYVVKNGYCDALLSAMNKLDMKGLGKDTLSKSMNFSLETIKAFDQRKAILAKKNMDKMKFMMEGNYLSETVDMIEEEIFGKINPLITENDNYQRVNEFVQTIIEEGYMREFFDFGKKKLKPIQQNEIDYVQAKSQDIQSIDDKIMLISYINSKLDLIDFYKKVMEDKKASKKYIIQNSMNQLIRFESTLTELKNFIMNYKIPEKNNELVSWYPAGYEG